MEAATAVEAIQYLVSNKEPHIAFLDCHLPLDGDGELFARLAPLLAKEVAQHSFVLMTSNPDMECQITDLAMDQQYVQLLFKPFPQGAVEKAVSNANEYLAGKAAAASIEETASDETAETLEELAKDNALVEYDISSPSHPGGQQPHHYDGTVNDGGDSGGNPDTGE
jgi:DNA-binding NtrC family response regulator